MQLRLQVYWNTFNIARVHRSYFAKTIPDYLASKYRIYAYQMYFGQLDFVFAE